MQLVTYLEAQPLVFIAAAAALGLLVGSFLNVVVYRLPVMMERGWRRDCAEITGQEAPAETEPFSLVSPRSRCPSCGHGVTALENIPIVSYIALRGRCSACGWSIPLRYPLVEAFTGLLSGIVAWHFGPSLAGAGALLVTWALIALAFIDFDTQLLPDGITLPFLWLGLAFNIGAVYADLSAAVIGAIAGYGVLWLVFHGFRLLTGKEGMGYGDFKLLAMLGAWQGWTALPAIVLLSSVVGAVIGIALIVGQGRDRSIPIPFGPYLAIAGWITMLWGDALLAAYLGWTLGAR